MTLKFKVLSTNKDTGTIEVNYFDDESFLEGVTLNVPIPLENGQYPTTEKVMEIISRYAPTRIIEMEIEKKSSILDMTHIDAMVNTEIAITPVTSKMVMTVHKAVF